MESGSEQDNNNNNNKSLKYSTISSFNQVGGCFQEIAWLNGTRKHSFQLYLL